MSDNHTIRFDHKVFGSFAAPCFRRSAHDGQPVMVVDMGGSEVSLPLDGICREFGIAGDSPDGAMLGRIAEALGFVKILRPGDKLPTEILTGEPSWQASPRHTEIAMQRLNMQLVTWMSGGETLITDPEALLQVAEDPKTRQRVSAAFQKAAEALGFGSDRERVVGTVETLAAELTHIEALRDMYGEVVSIYDRIRGLRRIYADERSVFDIADRVARLTGLARDGFAAVFAQLDANTGEIMSVLRHIDRQVAYVRETRDALYRPLSAWREEMFPLWHNRPVKAGPKVPDVLRQTYRFLAPRYMPVDEWKLLTRLRPDGGNTTSAVTW